MTLQPTTELCEVRFVMSLEENRRHLLVTVIGCSMVFASHVSQHYNSRGQQGRAVTTNDVQAGAEEEAVPTSARIAW